MSSTSCDDPRSMVFPQECGVPPIPPVMGRRHKPHWNQIVVADGTVRGMWVAVGVPKEFLVGEQDVARM